jgi:transcriptional regulator with XRE-family HTH domain
MTKDESAKNIELGRLVVRHRLAADLSQRQAAKAAGVDIHTMNKLERGGYASPSPKTLTGVARALNIPLLELFRTAGYLTPYDVIDIVRGYQPSADPAPALVEESSFDDERNRFIERLIEEHGLDYVGPEYEALNPDH